MTVTSDRERTPVRVGRLDAGRQDRLVFTRNRSALHLLDEAAETHWACDPRGRLIAGHAGERHVQVGLDGSVLLRVGDRRRGYGAGALTAAERDALFEAVAAAARRALDALAARRLELSCADPDGRPRSPREARALLERIAGWDAAAYAEHRRVFARVYRPVRVLPPDCYRALVVQLTEGCSHGRCTFCTLYRDAPFRAKDERALGEHLQGIRELVGEGIGLRDRVFLGDANACLLPTRRLVDAMDQVRSALPEVASGGFSSFVDVFTGAPKERVELEALRAAGLGRLYLGLESGHQPLLRWLEKPATPQGVLALADRLGSAGIELGVIVLVGAGGAAFAEDHVRDTLDLIGSLGLGQDDAVYLSPLALEHTSPEYAARAARDGVRALSPAEVRSQATRLREALRAQGLRVIPYDLRRWTH